MKIIITGGSGFLGQRVARELLKRGQVNDADGKPQPIREIVLLDIAPPSRGLLHAKVRYAIGDAATRSSSPIPLATTLTVYSTSRPWSAVPQRPTSTSACA